MKRDYIENLLVKHPSIEPLEPRHIPLINQQKNGSFGLSYTSYLLYAHGNSAGFRSSHYPKGFLYRSAHMFAAIGIFENPLYPETPCFHIIAPSGINWRQELNNLKSELTRMFPGAICSARHLTDDQQRQLLEDDWYSSEEIPHHLIAHREDETEGRGLIDLRQLKDSPKKHMHDSAYRAALKAYPNFVSANGKAGIEINISWEAYSDQYIEDGQKIISAHFNYLQGKLVGSQALDYHNVIRNIPKFDGKDQTYSYIAYLNIRYGSKEPLKIPLSLFAFELLNKPGEPKLAGGYCTITRRGGGLKDLMIAYAGNIDFIGFASIPTRVFSEIFEILSERHEVEYVDLGGSELKVLHDFKKKLFTTSPEITSKWAVGLREEDELFSWGIREGVRRQKKLSEELSI